MTPSVRIPRFRFFILLCFVALCAVTLVAASTAKPSNAAAVPFAQPETGVPPDGTEPLPAGATVTTVLTGLQHGPVAMAFDPQGRLFFTEKGEDNGIGAVRLYANGTLQASPVITFSVDGPCSERGLLGIATDPNFNSNHYIYVYYTAAPAQSCGSTENRVVRFVENNGVGSNPVTIFTSPQDAPNHNGGNIHFGPDGKLYITIGDNANAANSQDVTVKNGKIHRINADGTIPSDNPVFTQTGALPSLYAYGVRNTFNFTFDPFTAMAPYPRIFASENGPSCDDEMNRIEADYNYGWRANYPCDDPNPSPVYNTIHPLWYIPNGACCEAPTGITIYMGQQIPQWTGELFMSTNNSSLLRHFYLDGTRTTVTAVNVVQGVSVEGDIETGPDGALWFFDLNPYVGDVNLQKITGPGPTSTPHPSPTTTNTPQPGITPSATSTTQPGVTPSATIPTDTPVPASPTPYQTPTPCTITFTDVPPGSTFYPYIQCLACQGIVGGYADGTFRPNNNVTRGQIAKIVSNSAGFDTVMPEGQQSFEDVPPGSTFYTYTERLSMANVMSGYPCGGEGEPCGPNNLPYFRPNNNATRGQIAKIIANAAGFNDEIGSGTQTFEDVAPGSTFYDYIERLLLNRPGAMSGYPCGGDGEPCGPTNLPYFRPNNNATRGQTTKIVYNVFFPDCVVPVHIKIENFGFHPNDITVPLGTVIRFVNRDLDYHTATAVDSSFNTDRLYQNQFKDIVFNTLGDFEYYCQPHPYMRGYIHVIAGR